MLIPLNYAFYFLIKTVFELYIFFVLLRIVFHWVNVSPHNSLLIAIARITHPPLKLIYYVLPPIQGIDCGAIILLLTLSIAKMGLLSFLLTGILLSLKGLTLLAFAEILKQFVDLFFYVLLFLGIMSWFSLLRAGPGVEIVIKISDALLKPIRRILPALSGIDFSPMVALIGLQLITLLIINPLHQIGNQLTHLVSLLN